MINPVLRGPNWNFPFHIHTDASNYAIGAVLEQQEEDNSHYAIYYISKNLVGAKRNYTTTEKEFVAVIHAINKFWHYIIRYQVFVHIDHATIKYLMNKLVVSGRIIRWLLLLQEFNVTIIDKPRKANVVADFLSKLIGVRNDELVEDSFPDEKLFAISIHTPWFVDIANYVVTRKVPPYYSPRKKKGLIKESASFKWVSGMMFKCGLD